MEKTNKKKTTAEQISIEKCLCNIDLAASTRENSEEIRKHTNAIRKLFADVKAGQKKDCWYAKDIYNDDDRKIICEGCEEDCKYNRKETPVNREYEDLFEQYKQENANWEKYLTDSTYYELMDFYDDKYHIKNEDHYSDEGREFANYIWYKYVEEKSSVKKNPLSQDFKKFEEAYLEKEKDEILCIYDRHAGLVDGTRWQQQKDREKILLLKDQIESLLAARKCNDELLKIKLKEQKEQLLGDSIEGYVDQIEFPGSTWISLASTPDGITDGDTVKVYIVKE